MDCISKCDCDDDACRSACTMPSACQQCQLGFVSCSSSCTSEILSCVGNGDDSDASVPRDASFNIPDGAFNISDGSIKVGDATINLNKTCGDLQTCCNSLSDSAQKMSCNQIYNTISGSGNQACSAAIANFCP